MCRFATLRLAQSMETVNEAPAAAPDNPRLLWVHGANQWYNTPERGGGQTAALATYEKRHSRRIFVRWSLDAGTMPDEGNHARSQNHRSEMPHHHALAKAAW